MTMEQCQLHRLPSQDLLPALTFSFYGKQVMLGKDKKTFKTVQSTKVAQGLCLLFSAPSRPLHTMTHTRTLERRFVRQKPRANRSRKCHPKVIFQAPKYVLSMELDQNQWALHQTFPSLPKNLRWFPCDYSFLLMGHKCSRHVQHEVKEHHYGGMTAFLSPSTSQHCKTH